MAKLGMDPNSDEDIQKLWDLAVEHGMVWLRDEAEKASRAAAGGPSKEIP